MDLEVLVGAVAKELRAARPEVGEPGDVLSRRQGGCLVHVDRPHVLPLSLPETSEILSLVAPVDTAHTGSLYLGGHELLSAGGAVVVTLRRWVVPNIWWQLILERCIHGVAEQFQSRIRPEGNSALHNQPLLVVHDDLQALELVAIHGPHPAQEAGALIELRLGCIGNGTTRRARLSENRRDDFTPLDRPYQDRAVEYDVFGK